MTPKEKAKELVVKFTFQRDNHEIYIAKQCALICIDEIIKENERINEGGVFPTPLTEWWQEVKKEIELL